MRLVTAEEFLAMPDGMVMIDHRGPFRVGEVRVKLATLDDSAYFYKALEGGGIGATVWKGTVREDDRYMVVSPEEIKAMIMALKGVELTLPHGFTLTQSTPPADPAGQKD